MKNKIVFYCLLVTASCVVLPNTALGQYAKLKAEYQCITKIGNQNYAGKNTLYCNTDKSVYIHEDWPKRDTILWNDNAATVIKGDAEGMPVFIDVREALVYYKLDWLTSRASYVITDKIEAIKWEIDNQQKSIGKYVCKHATGKFGGRVYDVWFTLDIPLGFGPYKLWGLPGLIVVAQSKDGLVRYDLTSVKMLKPQEFMLEKPKIGKYISLSEYNNLLVNRLLKAEALSDENGQVTCVDPPENWYIEKSILTTVADYRKARSSKKKTAKKD